MDKGGKKGKGHQGTCIKDTWTKPKGVGLRVGGGGQWSRGEQWGENGDNSKKKKGKESSQSTLNILKLI